MEHQISERGRALILAAAILDELDASPDIVLIARQLIMAQQELQELTTEELYKLEGA